MAQKQKLQNSGMQIPDDAIARIAQAMLPLMQQYFESEEGRLQLSRQTEALEQKEAAPASQPAPPLFILCSVSVLACKQQIRTLPQFGKSSDLLLLVTRRRFELRTHCLKGKALILRAGGSRKPVAALALFDLVCFACM
ncbi:MAG: hypothetical protein ACI3WQ_01860 [Faecousia sp.]